MINLKNIAVLLFSLVVPGLAIAQTEVLYNGIHLPEQWPPRYTEPQKAQDMPIPYLEQKPGVIPVNVGRQLFVDSFLIAETNLNRAIHTPRFYERNPVLGPDKEWEKTTEGGLYAAPFSDGIWYDEKDGKFKMWYLAGAGVLHKGDNQTFYTGYAESEDGKHWTKPVLDIWNQTNIVDTCNRDAATIWLDKQEKDPSKRYKMFNVERRPTDRRWQFILKYSSDGIHWGEGVAQSGDLYDRSSAFYNPFRDVWALSMRYGTTVSSRSRSYLENKDPEMAVSFAHRIRKGVPDKNMVYWFTPSDKEPRHPEFPEVEPGIYNFDAIAYESIMLGLYSVWQGPENGVCAKLGIQKKNEIFLGYSRDGFHFYRPSFKPFMAVNETEGAWNWGNMQSINGVPLVVGDSLYFYSSGRQRINIINRELLMENTKKTLYKEIQQAYYNATASQEKYTASDKSVTASKEAFNYAQERYNAGKSTVFEFNEAKTKYAQSLAEQAQAKYDFIFRTKILDFYNGKPPPFETRT